MVELFQRRLLNFLPTLELWWMVGPLSLVYGIGAARVSGWLRSAWNVRVAYTRKVFHFSIIPVAAAVQVLRGPGGTVVYGTAISFLVCWSVIRGEGHPLYDALARPRDRPRQSLFILVPLVMTGVGGVLSTLFFGPFATVGYWVCGFGDAVGEPVGRRWGHHSYEVPSLANVPAVRTLEGSLAVWLAGSTAGVLALVQLGIPPGPSLKTGLACGTGVALVEAFSNHGLDNLTTQLAGAGMAWLLLAP